MASRLRSLSITILVPVFLAAAIIAGRSDADDWLQNGSMFNPSGIPSLRFSQPRFADLDADGDADLILGSLECAPLYFENVGSDTDPDFAPGPDIFSPISALDAEVGVCADLDDDGDLDLVTGGFHGLQLFENIGTASEPVWVKIENFFAGLVVGVSPAPALADMDGDDDVDLLVGLSESGHVKYYPNSGTPSAAEFREADAQDWFNVGLYAYPWLGDLDGDDDFDLLLGSDATGFFFWRNVGTPFVWEWQAEHELFAGLAGSTYWNSPSLVDLTGDTQPDLVYGTADGPLAYYRNTGTPSDPIWTEDASLFGGTIDVGAASSPFLFDFDGDGDDDLVSGSQLGDIKYYENVGTATAPAWQADHDLFASIDHSIYSAITLGDVDGTELPDAVVGDLSGNLYYHRNTGTTFVYDSSVFDGINVGGFSVPRLVNMDDDGDLDLVVGDEAGGLHYFENQGGDPVAWVEIYGYFGSLNVGVQCAPTMGDFDFDGDMDLVTGDMFNEVQYFENVGGTWQEDPEILEGITVGQNAAPALCDLDGDRDLDLVVGNYGGTFDYFENLRSDPAGVTQATGARVRLALTAHPNPFHLQTTLRYVLPSWGRASLAIYDVSGRLVDQLVHGNQAAGGHRIRWSGTDDTGAALTPGVYFCRLQASGHRETIKIVRRR